MPVANCKITGITRNTDNERISVCHARSFVRWQLHTGNTGNRRLADDRWTLSRSERAPILTRNPSFASWIFRESREKTRLCMYVSIVRFITIRTISLTCPDWLLLSLHRGTCTGLTLFRDSFSARKGSVPRREVEQGRRCARRLIE